MRKHDAQISEGIALPFRQPTGGGISVPYQCPQFLCTGLYARFAEDMHGGLQSTVVSDPGIDTGWVNKAGLIVSRQQFPAIGKLR